MQVRLASNGDVPYLGSVFFLPMPLIAATKPLALFTNNNFLRGGVLWMGAGGRGPIMHRGIWTLITQVPLNGGLYLGAPRAAELPRHAVGQHLCRWLAGGSRVSPRPLLCRRRYGHGGSFRSVVRKGRCCRIVNGCRGTVQQDPRCSVLREDERGHRRARPQPRQRKPGG